MLFSLGVVDKASGENSEDFEDKCTAWLAGQRMKEKDKNDKYHMDYVLDMLVEYVKQNEEMYQLLEGTYEDDDEFEYDEEAEEEGEGEEEKKEVDKQSSTSKKKHKVKKPATELEKRFEAKEEEKKQENKTPEKEEKPEVKKEEEKKVEPVKVETPPPVSPVPPPAKKKEQTSKEFVEPFSQEEPHPKIEKSTKPILSFQQIEPVYSDVVGSDTQVLETSKKPIQGYQNIVEALSIEVQQENVSLEQKGKSIECNSFQQSFFQEDVHEEEGNQSEVQKKTQIYQVEQCLPISEEVQDLPQIKEKKQVYFQLQLPLPFQEEEKPKLEDSIKTNIQIESYLTKLDSIAEEVEDEVQDRSVQKKLQEKIFLLQPITEDVGEEKIEIEKKSLKIQNLVEPFVQEGEKLEGEMDKKVIIFQPNLVQAFSQEAPPPKYPEIQKKQVQFFCMQRDGFSEELEEFKSQEIQGKSQVKFLEKIQPEKGFVPYDGQKEYELATQQKYHKKVSPFIFQDLQQERREISAKTFYHFENLTQGISEEDNSMAAQLFEKKYKTEVRGYPVLPHIEFIQEKYQMEIEAPTSYKEIKPEGFSDIIEQEYFGKTIEWRARGEKLEEILRLGTAEKFPQRNMQQDTPNFQEEKESKQNQAKGNKQDAQILDSLDKQLLNSSIDSKKENTQEVSFPIKLGKVFEQNSPAAPSSSSKMKIQDDSIVQQDSSKEKLIDQFKQTLSEYQKNYDELKEIEGMEQELKGMQGVMEDLKRRIEELKQDKKEKDQQIRELNEQKSIQALRNLSEDKAQEQNDDFFEKSFYKEKRNNSQESIQTVNEKKEAKKLIKLERQVQEAIFYIFNAYQKESLKMVSNPTFDDYDKETKSLHMRDFMIFCRDFQVQISKVKVSEIFKKVSNEDQVLSMIAFRKALEKIIEEIKNHEISQQVKQIRDNKAQIQNAQEKKKGKLLEQNKKLREEKKNLKQQIQSLQKESSLKTKELALLLHLPNFKEKISVVPELEKKKKLQNFPPKVPRSTYVSPIRQPNTQWKKSKVESKLRLATVEAEKYSTNKPVSVTERTAQHSQLLPAIREAPYQNNYFNAPIQSQKNQQQQNHHSNKNSSIDGPIQISDLKKNKIALRNHIKHKKIEELTDPRVREKVRQEARKRRIDMQKQHHTSLGYQSNHNNQSYLELAEKKKAKDYQISGIQDLQNLSYLPQINQLLDKTQENFETSSAIRLKEESKVAELKRHLKRVKKERREGYSSQKGYSDRGGSELRVGVVRHRQF